MVLQRDWRSFFDCKLILVKKLKKEKNIFKKNKNKYDEDIKRMTFNFEEIMEKRREVISEAEDLKTKIIQLNKIN